MTCEWRSERTSNRPADAGHATTSKTSSCPSSWILTKVGPGDGEVGVSPLSLGEALLLDALEGDDEEEPLRCLRVCTGLRFGQEEENGHSLVAQIRKHFATRRYFDCLERSLQPIEAAPRLIAQLNRSTVLHVPVPPKLHAYSSSSSTSSTAGLYLGPRARPKAIRVCLWLYRMYNSKS